jgi:hypothetical protein
MDWIHLAHGRKMWRDVVNAVMNFRDLSNAGNFLISEDPLASQKGFCSMELVSH